MTSLVAIVDFNKHHLVFQTAGHPSLIHLSVKKKCAFEVETNGRGGFPVGWFRDTKYLKEDNVECDFEQGDIFLAYTDGLTDLENEAGEALDQSVLFSLLVSFIEDGVHAQPIPYLLRSSLEQIGYTNATDDVSIVEFREHPAVISRDMGVPSRNMISMVRSNKAEISKCVEHFGEFVQGNTKDLELATRVELLLSEFLNNVVDHDPGSGNSSLRIGIVVDVSLREPDIVSIVVLDREAKWEKNQLKLDGTPNEVFERANKNMASSGRGLAIIRTITSSITRKHYSGVNRTEFLVKAKQPWNVENDLMV